MTLRAGSRLAIAIGSTLLLLALPPAARSNERKAAGGFRLTIGWGDEPAFSEDLVRRKPFHPVPSAPAGTGRATGARVYFTPTTAQR